jgi:hypothetical protein
MRNTLFEFGPYRLLRPSSQRGRSSDALTADDKRFPPTCVHFIETTTLLRMSKYRLDRSDIFRTYYSEARFP